MFWLGLGIAVGSGFIAFGMVMMAVGFRDRKPHRVHVENYVEGTIPQPTPDDDEPWKD